MYFFTADEHYGHQNIIRYCNRPYLSVTEMDNDLIDKHNQVVTKGDIVIHAGDFTLKNKTKAGEYISKLSGSHIFLQGSHDGWLNGNVHEIWERTIEGQHVVVCHYAMRTWGRSHYGSWELFGHSHGTLEPIGLQYDIGVDNNNYYPISFDQLKMKLKKEEIYGNKFLSVSVCDRA